MNLAADPSRAQNTAPRLNYSPVLRSGTLPLTCTDVTVDPVWVARDRGSHGPLKVKPTHRPGAQSARPPARLERDGAAHRVPPPPHQPVDPHTRRLRRQVVPQPGQFDTRHQDFARASADERQEPTEPAALVQVCGAYRVAGQMPAAFLELGNELDHVRGGVFLGRVLDRLRTRVDHPLTVVAYPLYRTDTPVVFPDPTPVATQPCAKCGTPTRIDRLWAGGYGEDCAEQLGLKTARPKVRTAPQSGATLFDAADEDDVCDGWDR